MNQVVFSLHPDISPIELPPPHAEVVHGVVWGNCGSPFSPAYWRALMHAFPCVSPQFRQGETLLEESVACLLGGHGMPAEVGVAAFRSLKSNGLIRPGIATETIERALSVPLNVHGRCVRYRFPRQKAFYISALVRHFESSDVPDEPLALREWLRGIPGIGPKTASWIVRNVYEADTVAILDVHILRAGKIMGLFPADIRLPSSYSALEQRYLSFCDALGVRASRLDGCIWAQMKRYRRNSNSWKVASPTAKQRVKYADHPHQMPEATTLSPAKQMALL